MVMPVNFEAQIAGRLTYKNPGLFLRIFPGGVRSLRGTLQICAKGATVLGLKKALTRIASRVRSILKDAELIFCSPCNTDSPQLHQVRTVQYSTQSRHSTIFMNGTLCSQQMTHGVVLNDRITIATTGREKD